MSIETSKPPKLKKEGGFTLIELIVAISISGVLALYALSELNRKSEEALAVSAASYMKAVSAAAHNNTLNFYMEYAEDLPVPGLATPLQPTVQELINLGRLSSAFPSGIDVLPTRQSVQINILRTNCPGPDCLLVALVCTTSPVTLGGTNVRFDLASTMVQELGGAGGQSKFGTGGATISGPLINVPNPVGNIEGIVCSSSMTDAGIYERFLKMRDNRDPELRGNLSVDGDLTIKGSTKLGDDASDKILITGNTTIIGGFNIGNEANPCVRLQVDGRIATNCLDPNDIPPGWGGGVRTIDVVAGGRIVATTNATNPTAGQYTMIDGGANSGQASLATSGRAQADRLVPTGLYGVNTACNDDLAIAKNSSGAGLVFCSGGLWTPFASQGAVGGACAPNGSSATSPSGQQLICLNGSYYPMDSLLRVGTADEACTIPGSTAVDPATGAALICRANPQAPTNLVFRQLRNLTTNLSFAYSVEVSNGSVVNHPTCTGSGVSLPIIQMIPKNMSSDDNAFAFYASNNGVSWTVHIQSGAGGPWGNNAGPGSTAIAQVFCYYP